MKKRTDQEIVEQTERLAHEFSRVQGRLAHRDFQFHLADRARDQVIWRMACEAQIMLTATDPRDACSNLGWDCTS